MGVRSSNLLGSTTSTACRVAVAPPFTIRAQPAPQLVLLNGAVLSGAGIDGSAIRPGSLVGKTLSFELHNFGRRSFCECRVA